MISQTIRPTLRADAERAVARLEDVERVENQIEVLPVSPHDDRLRLEIYRNIYRNGNFSTLANRAIPPIHIIVKNGVVTLEGVVLRGSDKILAGILANRALVFSVTNNLVVEG